jgi:hypothetical protein
MRQPASAVAVLTTAGALADLAGDIGRLASHGAW